MEGGIKNRGFSINISLNFENGTKYGHMAIVTMKQIGTRMRSIECGIFNGRDPNPHFQGHANIPC